MAGEKGTQVVRDVEKDLFAALGRPLLSIDAVEVKRKKTVTSHAEISLFAIGAGVVGLAAAMWILGLGLAPTTDSAGNPRVMLTQRPRMSMPFSNFPNVNDVLSGVGPTNPLSLWSFLTGTTGGVEPVARSGP